MAGGEHHPLATTGVSSEIPACVGVATFTVLSVAVRILT